jgi:outer membrane protein TolC
VEISRGIKQQATGQFDLALAGSFSHAHTNSPLTLSERALVVAEGFAPTANAAQNLSILNLGVTKLYRSGVAISPVYETARTTDNLTTSEGTNVSRLAFQVTVPLLRGRGRGAVAAQETAAGVEVSASLLDLNQTISDLLASTAISYWNAVAAVRQLEVARASEDRGKLYVDNVQTLIQADRLAKAEINQATANLDARIADRIAAEQNLTQSQQQLALAIGTEASQMANANSALESLPDPDAQRALLLNAQTIADYIQQALSRRADYLAAQKRVEEARVLLIAAQNMLKPRLDLSFDTGVSGLSEGTAPAQFFNSPYHSIQGLDAVAGVTYNLPLRNNIATGQVRQAQASLNQAQLKVADLSRHISSAVVTAVNAVHNASAQVGRARESVRSFEAALQGEREKFTLGFSSVVDVLTIEDRLTTAMTNQVSAEFAYATSLTQLRSATGTIVEPDKTVQSVSRDLFVTLP